MTHYARGAAAERRAKRLLEQRGYWVCRAAGSHGDWDLVALRRDGVLVVQVKRGRGASPAERAHLASCFPGWPRVRKELWRFTGRGKPLVEVL